jgi:3-deoxy-D-manno-octulosonate 8-phosphate phosphatase (KDO 8-P phosphatase)
LSAPDDELRARAAKIELILMDVDGVLTDGRVLMLSNGVETRSFDIHDGLGIRMAQHVGIGFGIISGRKSAVVDERARSLGIDEVHQNVLRKGELLDGILERRSLAPEATCFIGDDLIDLPLMRRVGLAAAPASARPEVRAAAHFVSELDGGRGAVRDVVDLVLRARGDWDTVTERYFT